MTRFLCTRCWATIHLDPLQFVTYTVAGAVFGAIVTLVIVLAGHRHVIDPDGALGLVVCPAGLAGQFLPKLLVEDPPLK